MPPLSLEDFGEPVQPDLAAGPTAIEADEELRLSAYEEGYGAGWEDAITAQSDAREEREAEVARHLQALAFGYHEARQHLLRSIEPLLREIASSLLPQVARQLLAPAIAEVLLPLAERRLDAPILLRIAPGCRAAVERMLAITAGDLPFEIVEDVSLSGGQALIDAGHAELRVDLDGSAAAILGLITDYFDSKPTEQSHAG